MPGMNGLEVIKEIRKDHTLDDIKCIGISATVTDSILKDDFFENCNDFLTKPVNLSLFFEKIQKSLNIKWVLIKPSASSEKSIRKDEFDRLPPVSYMTRIREATELGDFTLVEDILKELDKMNIDYSWFNKKIRDFSLQYDDEGILTMLDKTLSKEDGQQN